VITAGQLHRDVGGYPGPSHRMPVCCSVMRQEMSHRDKVVAEPPKGAGASLTISYRVI
jgi:5-methylcytosine-specific restriction protein A